LLDWLSEAGCSHVAMESTGVYGKPVCNSWEGQLPGVLVNARHSKAEPGRKTDGRDWEWLADLLRHGWGKARFIPPREIREIRELPRYRQAGVKEHTAVANRSQKGWESGNIKLGQGASDVVGLSGRLMWWAVAAGEQDGEKLAELAQGRWKTQKAEVRQAVAGQLTAVPRGVLSELLARGEELDRVLTRVEARLREEVEACPDPFVPAAVALLDSIPGVGEHGVHTLGAEIGVARARFPSEGPLASWAGMSPGHKESAGKRKRGQTTKGRPYLWTALREAAWAARHGKGTYGAAEVQTTRAALRQEESVRGRGAYAVAGGVLAVEAACVVYRPGE
jgi:transposase